jgi:hypothetical protein
MKIFGCVSQKLAAAPDFYLNQTIRCRGNRNFTKIVHEWNRNIARDYKGTLLVYMSLVQAERIERMNSMAYPPASGGASRRPFTA